MKYLIIVCIFCFSNCGLSSYIRINNAMQNTTVDTKLFIETMPIKLVNNIPIVKVKIQGNYYDFLFDTGANSAIDSTLVNKLKFKRLGKREIIDVRGKSKQIKYVELEELSINSVHFNNIALAVTNNKVLRDKTCENIVGIIGKNIMKHAIWQINYQEKTILLTNKRDTLKTPNNSHYIRFFSSNDNNILIRLSSNNVFLSDAELDTGSNGYISFSKKHTNNSLDSLHFIKVFGYGYGAFSTGIDTVLYSKLPKIALGYNENDVFENVPITLSKAKVEHLIGNAFLKNYIFTLDWSRQEIILTPNIYKGSSNTIFNSFGIGITFLNGKLKVGAICENTEAHKIGITLNDEIVEFNGQDFRNPTQQDYCNLKYPHEDYLKIVIRKNNIEKTYILKKTNLFE